MAGLAAARELQRLGAHPIVLEATGQVGGKLRASEVGGVLVDEGADSMLRRVPWGVDLAVAAGLELVSPAVGAASLWSRGALVPMPLGTVMGIPTELGSLAGLVRNPVRETLTVPPLEDLSVGALVSRSLGREVVDRLVDPLLGGVYAGHADRLSVQATLPQLWPHLAGRTSLVEAARAARGTPAPGPVFAGLVGGLGTLPPRLAAGLDVRVNATVRGLEKTPTGWRLELVDAFLEVDAVILAVPAGPAARLLDGLVPVQELGQVDYASVGIITLVLDGPSPGTGSGYLVPAVDGHITKAVTFTSRKWGRPGPAVIRASVGRAGAVADLQRDDADLVAIVLRELEAAVGSLPPVLGTRVTRWGGGLPQYAVGHLDLVARLRRTLPAGLALAGAAFDGVGVPAVARSGLEAARSVAGDDVAAPPS